MASSNPIILSSSSPTSWIETTPPRERNWISMMSSSPALPSPSQLIKQNKQIIASRSRVVAAPAGVPDGFVRASTLLGQEDFNQGGASPARLSLSVGKNEKGGEATSVKNIGNGRPVDESVIAAPVKKLGAPRRRVGGKKGAAQTAGIADVEHVTAAGATVSRKRKAPRRNAAAGGKKLSSTMVAKEDDEDIILGEVSPVKKLIVAHSKSTALLNKLDNPTFAEGERQDELLVKSAATKKPRAARRKPTAIDVQLVEPAILEGHTEASRTIEAAPLRKSRAKKTKDDGQTKLKKGKIVKRPTGEELGETTTKRSSKKRKSDPGNDSDLPLPKDAISAEGRHESLGLDQATTRRRDWTPVMNGNKEAADDPRGMSCGEHMLSIIDITTDTSPGNDFRAHLSHYSFNQAIITEPLNAPVQDGDRPAPTKRRKMQLIDTSDHLPPRAKLAKKSKALKKKPQTITEKATAPFLPEQPPNPSPLLQYLTQSASPRVQPAEEPAAKPSIKGRGQKTVSKDTKSKAIKAKTTKPTHILLPPEEALNAMKDQDLLFGTSSQLVGNESPTFVRDLQQAFKASESFHVLPNTPQGDATHAAYLTESTVLRKMSSRNLWSEAARDSQGSLLEPEVIHLMDTPNPRETTGNLIAFAPMPQVDRLPKPLVEDTCWTAVDDVQPPALEAATEDGIVKPVSSETVTAINNGLYSLPRCIAEAALRPRLKNRSPEKKKKKRLPDGQEDTTGQMPNYQGFTTDRLSVAISKYGFKPIKGRDAMIALLERCWESKARLALQSLPPNLNVPSLAPPSDQRNTNKAENTSQAKRKGRPPKVKDSFTTTEGIPSKSTPSPAKPRGRPKKSRLPPAIITTGELQSAVPALATPPKPKPKLKAAANEIEDPDPPLTPSPPRRRSCRSPLQALPLTGLSRPVNSATPSLFDSITEAITTLPPNNEPQNLGWHEKILLYDPIVLEDLTTWLNTEGLKRVGVDQEVGAEAVKEWCEGRSVCCLWREGRRGNRGKGAGKG